MKKHIYLADNITWDYISRIYHFSFAVKTSRPPSQMFRINALFYDLTPWELINNKSHVYLAIAETPLHFSRHQIQQKIDISSQLNGKE